MKRFFLLLALVMVVSWIVSLASFPKPGARRVARTLGA